MAKAGLIDEMMNDALDSALDNEDIEEETDAEVEKVGGGAGTGQCAGSNRHHISTGGPSRGLIPVGQCQKIYGASSSCCCAVAAGLCACVC